MSRTLFPRVSSLPGWAKYLLGIMLALVFIRACLPIHYSQVVVLRNTTGKAVRCRLVTNETTTFWREVPAHATGDVSVLRSKVEFGYVEIEGSNRILPVKSTGEWNTPIEVRL